MNNAINKSIDLFYQGTNLGRIIKMYEEYRNMFKVGDVVNLILHPGSIASFDDGLPKRYQVVLVDDMGQPWLQRISRKRGFTRRAITPLGILRVGTSSEFDALIEWGETRVYTKMQLDAEYMASILLGFKFNPRAIYQKSKLHPKKKKGRYT